MVSFVFLIIMELFSKIRLLSSLLLLSNNKKNLVSIYSYQRIEYRLIIIHCAEIILLDGSHETREKNKKTC